MFLKRQVRWSGIISFRIFRFVVIHTVKGFGIVKNAEIDVFLELSCFLNDPADVQNLMSGSNCCFLTCMQISQEAGKLVWYSYLLKNFLQFVVVHTVKGFSIVSETEVDVFFWNSIAFSMIQRMLAI